MATVVGVRTAGAWVGLAPVEMHTAAAATIACKALPALVRACMNELDLPFLFIGRRAFSLQFLGCLGTQFLMLEKETKVLFLPHGIEPVIFWVSHFRIEAATRLQPHLQSRGGGHFFSSLWPSEVLPSQGSSLSASYHVLPVSYQVSRGLREALWRIQGNCEPRSCPTLVFSRPWLFSLFRP